MSDNPYNDLKPSIDNYYLEAMDRNAVLSSCHGSIPSYALWRDIDIEKESIDTRIAWWQNYIDHKVIIVSSIAISWTDILKPTFDY